MVSISRVCRCATVFVMLAAIASATGTVRAQDSTYEPTPGFDRVTAAVKRLGREGDKLPKRTLQSLQTEGKAIVDLEQTYYRGEAPIQRDIKAFKSRPAPTTPEEEARFRQDSKRLSDRVNAETKLLVARYAAFVRDTNIAFGAASDGDLVKDAVSKHQKPPFAPTWNCHQYNRGVARKMLPLPENTCALVVSLTLGVKPYKKDGTPYRKGDASVKDVASASPEVRRQETANRYVRANELAVRLVDEFGKPDELKGAAAADALQNRNGVIFFKDGYGNKAISHIDLWDGTTMELGDQIQPAFENASYIWFWELPK